MLWLFSALGVVVVALGVVAAVLWAKVWRLQKQQKALEEQRQRRPAAATFALTRRTPRGPQKARRTKAGRGRQ